MCSVIVLRRHLPFQTHCKSSTEMSAHLQKYHSHIVVQLSNSQKRLKRSKARGSVTPSLYIQVISPRVSSSSVLLEIPHCMYRWVETYDGSGAQRGLPFTSDRLPCRRPFQSTRLTSHMCTLIYFPSVATLLTRSLQAQSLNLVS